MWKKELVSFVALGGEKRKYPICFDLAMGDMCYFSTESALFAREEDRTAGQRNASHVVGTTGELYLRSLLSFFVSCFSLLR